MNRNDRDGAVEAARAVSRLLEDRARRGGQLTNNEYRFWAAAEDLIGDKGSFRSIVSKWTAANPDDPQAKQILQNLSSLAIDKQLVSSIPQAAEIARLLLEMAERSGDEAALTRRVVSLYQMAGVNTVPENVSDILADAATVPEPLVRAIGNGAASAGDYETAIAWLGRVIDQSPEDAAMHNNLAWCLMMGAGEGELDQARAAAERATQIAPENVEYADTMGQILLKQGEPEQAITFLQIALNGKPRAKEVHRALAQAYAAIGNQTQADIHQQQSE